MKEDNSVEENSYEIEEDGNPIVETNTNKRRYEDPHQRRKNLKKPKVPIQDKEKRVKNSKINKEF